MLDPFTYGKTAACINLVDILNKPENSWATRKCGKILSEFNLKMLYSRCLDRKLTLRNLLMWKNEYLKHTYELNAPDIVKSHLRTIICTRYKIWYKTYSTSELPFYTEKKKDSKVCRDCGKIVINKNRY